MGSHQHFSLGFEGGANIAVERHGSVSGENYVGTTVQAVRQEGRKLMLDLSNGETLEMELAEAAISVRVWDENGVLAYTGGVDAESWRLPTYPDYAEAVREARDHEWRSSFQSQMEAVDALIGYLRDPEMRQPHPPPHKRRRVRNWLTALLKSVRSVQHHLRVGREMGVAVAAEAERFAQAQELTRQSVHENLEWAKERLRHELEALVQPYCSDYWVRGLRVGHVGEMTLELMNRDSIQAHLRAPAWLHPELVPDPVLVQVVAQVDAVLREEGAQFWELDPGTMQNSEQRAQMNSREDWWWWLDERAGCATQYGCEP